MENSQYQELFLSESQEILTALNTSLVHLEKNPQDKKCLDDIFRQCHTLKGMAATMGYDKVVQLSHAMENVLTNVREGKCQIQATIISLLFSGFDLLEKLLEDIKSNKESIIHIEPLLIDLKNSVKEKTGEKSIKTKQNIAHPSIDNHTLDSHSVSSIRVNLDRLESLMNGVGELVTSKIRLTELAKKIDDKSLSDAVSNIEHIVNRLQDETMQIRLIPLEYLMNYFPRMVRDAAHKEGKEVNFSIIGSDIGIDRTVLDEINDPLIHILRNAVSHGIELPEVRKAKNKPVEGEIKITAHRERNSVILSITDDGSGLDIEKIKQKMMTEGKMSSDELEKMSKEDILMLVTLPGFSLSQTVTEESGRGVGMNVVRHKVEAIGGSMSIQSQVGRGCTISLRLPLSMAIIHVLLVKISNEICAIPLVNIIETINIHRDIVRRVEEQEIIPYRDTVLPLLCLQEKLGFQTKSNSSVKNDELSVVVCELFNKKIGLIVDQFIREEEVVVKNLTSSLHRIKGYSGATILSSGRVAMILDAVSFIQ